MNTTNKIALIIPAGGMGSRFEYNKPKQFYKLNGRELIILTIQNLQSIYNFESIIIPCKSDWVDFMNELLSEYDIEDCVVIDGGETRSKSVLLGLDKINNAKYVLIHDAVRPFVTKNLINKLINKLQTEMAVIPVIPITDTIKVLKPDNSIDSTADREKLFAAQTPQAFEVQLLKEANNYISNQNINPTDDASIVENYGFNVQTVVGEINNIKITTKEDLLKAEIIINRK
ncbi:2-C-methyl-D-erythritol 4-phosphate cytidylyltransferase [Candidatus Kapabacteria bacterium]|nr:2-C-methyl-D-erythritol 4-phosphate cytidylyltransferase [Candidatus Kapabacteria bacterium]